MDKTDVNIIMALCDKGERLSLDTLQGGRWNTDAFLTLAMVHFLRKEIDPLPDSTMDESMDVSKDYLIIYMKNKSVPIWCKSGRSFRRYITKQTQMKKLS